MNKQAFLADLGPHACGMQWRDQGDSSSHHFFAPAVAIRAYECEETETIFRQELHARYHTVDTGRCRSGTWLIAASQTMRYHEDPALGTADPAHLRDFVGAYELASGQRRTV